MGFARLPTTVSLRNVIPSRSCSVSTTLLSVILTHRYPSSLSLRLALTFQARDLKRSFAKNLWSKTRFLVIIHGILGSYSEKLSPQQNLGAYGSRYTLYPYPSFIIPASMHPISQAEGLIFQYSSFLFNRT